MSYLLLERKKIKTLAFTINVIVTNPICITKVLGRSHVFFMKFYGKGDLHQRASLLDSKFNIMYKAFTLDMVELEQEQ